MTQEIIAYLFLAIALVYIGFRFYSSIKKKAACNKCELMKVAKETVRNKKTSTN